MTAAGAEAYPPSTEWWVQALYPTGWGTVDSRISPEAANRALAWHRGHDPEVQHRLVERVTTSTVVQEARRA